MDIEIAVLAALSALWIGGVVYCLLGVVFARRFKNAVRVAIGVYTPSVSLLKPLSGLERNLEDNLESFFVQDYPTYDILFAVNRDDDPALDIVERLRQRYPNRRVEVIVADNSPYQNAKVYSMELMTRKASGDILVISDSDVHVTPEYLRTVVEPFANPTTGVATCAYRGAPGASIWSRLEALGMSTRFTPGVVVAWGLEDPTQSGMQFALGPTMAVRRECLDAMGGFPRMAHYLADDFVLGKWATEQGYRVVLSPYVLDHLVLGESFAATFRHQLRWARSSRCSRPWGYVGEGFTHPTAISLALALALIAKGAPVLAALIPLATLAIRWWVSWEVAWGILRDTELRRSWWLIPAGDLLGFVIWICGFTGRTILWRGIEYRVGQDGRFEAISQVETIETVETGEPVLVPLSPALSEVASLVRPIAEPELDASRASSLDS